MKHIKAGLLKGIVILIASLVTSQLFAGSITNSAHDFSGDGWNPSGRICVVCHTPHNADATVTASPLWNHEVTTATFTTYTSNTLDGTVGAIAGTSKLCLSCHDGTIAIDSFGGTNGGDFMTGGDKIGNDLSDDHPISVSYNATTASTDGGLHDPSLVNVTIGDTKQRSGTIATVLVPDGTVECASCHDVHNTFAVTGTKLLKVSHASSQLCLTCHDK